MEVEKFNRFPQAGLSAGINMLWTCQQQNRRSRMRVSSCEHVTCTKATALL